MKKIRLVGLVGIIFLICCSSSLHWKLKIEIPSEASFNLNQFKEIIITNFLVKKETKDINLSQEIVDYFNFELGQNFKEKIISKKISFSNEDLFSDKGFWKEINGISKKALFLTGSANYSEEIRKAILEEKRSERFEGPFNPEKKLAERKFYTINLNLYLIKAQTGEIVYKRSFKESKGYRNPNQTAYFAFFDLIQRIKDKLFRNILGGKKIEERYLISK